MKIFDPQLTGSIEVKNPISGSVTTLGSVIALGSDSSLTGSFTGSFKGDGSELVGVTVDSGSWDGIFTGSAAISGSLNISGAEAIQLTVEKRIRGQYYSVYNSTASTYAGYLITSGDFEDDATTDLGLAAGTGRNIRFYTSNNSTEKMRLTTGGNLGIGTTSPDSYFVRGGGLVVDSADAGSNIVILNDNNTFGSLFFAKGSTGAEKYQGYVEYEFNGDTLTFGTDRVQRMQLNSTGLAMPDSGHIGCESDTDLLTLASGELTVGGNLGIGINPSTKLDIKGVAGSPATSGTTQNGIFRIQNTTNNNTLDIGQIAGSPNGTWLQATDSSDLSVTYPLLLNPVGGNVGIGITNPNTALTIGAGTLTIRYASGDSSGLKLFQATGDVSTISNHYAGDIAFNTASTSQKMIIKNSGVVGIGSTGVYAGTTAILNLEGSGIALKNNKSGGSNNNWSYIQNTGTASNSDINFYTGNNESALNLSHTGIATFSADIIPKGNTRNISFQGSTTTNTNAQIQYDQLNDNAGQLFFKTANSAALATRLSISTDGVSTFTKQWGANLPILKAGNTVNNIATSTYDTVVIQADDVTSIRIREYNSGGNQEMGLSVGDNNASITSTQNLRFYTGATAGSSIYNGGGGIQALTIASTGLATFQASVQEKVKLVASSNEYLSLSFANNSSTTQWELGKDNNNGLFFYRANGGSDTGFKLNITSVGFTKIKANGGSSFDTGTYNEILNNNNTSGATALIIGNNAGSATNNSSSTTLLCADAGGDRLKIQGNGNVINVNNAYGQISDVKLKENIENATPKLADLLKVKIRNFNLIGRDTKQIGVIAQELEEVFPSMVEESIDWEKQEVTDEEGNVTTNQVDSGTVTKSVKYSVFTPMLIKAIQEQQTIIESQKSLIDGLTTRIETLER